MRAWWDIGIARTRCTTLVPRHRGHEVAIQDNARTSGRAGARVDKADMPDAGRHHRARGYLAGSHPHAAVGTAAPGAGKSGAIHQREVVEAAADGISGGGETVLGAASVGTGILLRDGGCGG